MEVSRGSVYLYDFEDYDKLSMDIEVLMDVNNEYDLTLYSRLPTRRLIEKVDLSRLEHYWITNNESATSIKPSFPDIIKSIKTHDITSNRIYFLDGLEYLYDNSDKDVLLSQLVTFADEIKMKNQSALSKNRETNIWNSVGKTVCII